MDEQQLWFRFRQNADLSAREAIIERYQSLVTRISAMFFGKRLFDDVEFDEYTQLGCVGLIESVDRYDASKGVAFETFATYRIRGAILNGLEKYSEKRGQIAFLTKLRKERHNSICAPSETGNKSLFDEMVEFTLGFAVIYMLDDTSLVQQADSDNKNPTFDLNNNLLIRRRINAAVDKLPEREKIIVTYHYFHQTSFDTIAGLLGISKGRVSQLHKQAVEHIRDALGKNESLDHYL